MPRTARSRWWGLDEHPSLGSAGRCTAVPPFARGNPLTSTVAPSWEVAIVEDHPIRCVDGPGRTARRLKICNDPDLGVEVLDASISDLRSGDARGQIRVMAATRSSSALMLLSMWLVAKIGSGEAQNAIAR